MDTPLQQRKTKRKKKKGGGGRDARAEAAGGDVIDALLTELGGDEKASNAKAQ